MKKNKKLLFNSLLIGAINFSSIVYSYSASGVTGDPDQTTVEGLNPVVNNVIGAIKWIGIVIAVVMVIYVGIKYLTAGAGTKATVKSDLLPMLIGAILIATSSTIVSSVLTAVTSNQSVD